MMKKELKGFVCGVVSTMLIAGGITFAAGQWKTIDVLENDITVMVDGKPVTESNFVYNDRTYLPLRAVADAVGKPVEYDEATNTAYIGSRPKILSELVVNPVRELENGICIYLGNDGEFYLDLKDVAVKTFRTDYDTFHVYAIKVNENNPNTWIYEDYDAGKDSRVVLYESPIYLDSAGVKYIKADDFVALGDSI